MCERAGVVSRHVWLSRSHNNATQKAHTRTYKKTSAIVIFVTNVDNAESTTLLRTTQKDALQPGAHINQDLCAEGSDALCIINWWTDSTTRNKVVLLM